MAINKVEFGGNTLIDLTADTVTAETLLEGETAHGADGEAIIGTLAPSGEIDLTDLTWSSRANTYTSAIVGKRYLILTVSNTTDNDYWGLVGCTQIWMIQNYSSSTIVARLYYVEATATTIRVRNPQGSSYRYERVALVE